MNKERKRKRFSPYYSDLSYTHKYYFSLTYVIVNIEMQITIYVNNIGNNGNGVFVCFSVSMDVCAVWNTEDQIKSGRYMKNPICNIFSLVWWTYCATRQNKGKKRHLYKAEKSNNKKEEEENEEKKCRKTKNVVNLASHLSWDLREYICFAYKNEWGEVVNYLLF